MQQLPTGLQGDENTHANICTWRHGVGKLVGDLCAERAGLANGHRVSLVE